MSGLSYLSPVDQLGTPGGEFESYLKQFACGLRVAVPGIVQSFNAAKQTVVVKCAVLEKMNVNTGGVPVATDMDLGLLVDIPIVVMGGGPFIITFPIAAGDECLVIFADMCFDAWYQSGGTDNVQLDKRR